MSRLIAWLGRIVFVLGVVVALGFGAHQGVAFHSPILLEDCDVYCPDDQECAVCCIRAGGIGGECPGLPPADTVCICEA
jgi:hypothetical protein